MFLFIIFELLFSSKINIKKISIILRLCFDMVCNRNLYYFSCDVDNYNKMLITTQKMKKSRYYKFTRKIT